MNRNNFIYTWQVNRNPFIDYPLLANYIWGANAGQTWFASLATTTNKDLNLVVYPNPASNYFVVSGAENDGMVTLISVSGQILFQKKFVLNEKIEIDLPTGIYFARIEIDGKEQVKKLMIK